MCTFLIGDNKMNKDEYYMGIALKEAKKAYFKGEVPVGAIIVFNDEIIAKGHNLRERTNDITKHAELIAIKRASHKYNGWRLEGTVMYVTLYPCPMCASAIVQSRIAKLVIGAPTLDLNNKKIVNQILKGNNTCLEVSKKVGIVESECKSILGDFFKLQRNKKC